MNWISKKSSEILSKPNNWMIIRFTDGYGDKRHYIKYRTIIGIWIYDVERDFYGSSRRVFKEYKDAVAYIEESIAKHKSYVIRSNVYVDKISFK